MVDFPKVMLVFGGGVYGLKGFPILKDIGWLSPKYKAFTSTQVRAAAVSGLGNMGTAGRGFQDEARGALASGGADERVGQLRSLFG